MPLEIDFDPTGHLVRLSTLTLPTFPAQDPDLALIVELWDRLANECKQRILELLPQTSASMCRRDAAETLESRIVQ